MIQTNYYRLLGVFAGITLIGYLYDKYNSKSLREKKIDDYELVRRHLLGDKTLHLEKHKPTIWIHIDYERNSRNWSSFYSRNSNEINIPFVFSVLTNVIKFCSNDFNVCLINDNSFKRLLPNWNIDLTKLSGTSLYLLRLFGITKILHMYGGMLLNVNCLVKDELLTLHNTMLRETDMYVAELETDGALFSKMSTFTSHKIMGCKKNSDTMKQYSDFISQLFSRDQSMDQLFTSQLDKKLNELHDNQKIGVISAKLLGVVDNQNKLITLDNLMDNQNIDFDRNMKILYVDIDKIKIRTKYGWFLRQSKSQLLDNKNVIAEFIL